MKKLLRVLLAVCMVLGIGVCGMVGAGAVPTALTGEQWLLFNGYKAVEAHPDYGSLAFISTHMENMLFRLGLLRTNLSHTYLPVGGRAFELGELNSGKAALNGGAILWEDWRRDIQLIASSIPYSLNATNAINAAYTAGTLVPHVQSAAPQNDAMLQLLIEEYFTPSAILIAEAYATDVVEYMSLLVGLADCLESYEQVLAQVKASVQSSLGTAMQQLEATLMSLNENALDQATINALNALFTSAEADFSDATLYGAYNAAYQQYYAALNVIDEERFLYQMAGTRPDGEDFLTNLRGIMSDFQDLVASLPEALNTAQTKWNAFSAAVYALIGVDPPVPPTPDKILLFFRSVLPAGLATVATWIVKYVFFGWLWGRWL